MKAIVTTLGLLAAAGLCGLPHLDPPLSGAAQENSAKVQSIEAASIYTTSPEVDLKKQLLATFEPGQNGKEQPAFPHSFHLRRLHQETAGMGASNIALVAGDDIAPAVQSTCQVFLGSDCNVVAFPAGKKSAKFWLVAYLGIGHSTPPQWLFKAASVEKQTLTFRYSKPKSANPGAETIQYFYWVPLPELKAATYELRLIDADKDRLMLSRWVSVP